MTAEMIVVAGTITFDPEHHGDMVTAANRVAEVTRTEQGCISYEFFADLNEPGRLHLFEEWKSVADLERHLEEPHLTDFYSALQASGVRTRDITRYQVSSHGPNRPEQSD